MFVPKSISRLHEIGNFNVKVLREKGDRNTQNMGRLFLTLNKPLWQSKHKKTRPLSFSVEILWKNRCKTFDPWMFGGNKTSYTLKKSYSYKLQVCLNTYDLLLPPGIEGLKAAFFISLLSFLWNIFARMFLVFFFLIFSKQLFLGYF